MAQEVQLSSADRVLFPEDGITKGDLFAYYERVGPTLVPHLRDRPFTMKRYREGIAGDGFFQKQAPKGMPSWIPTRRFTTHPRRRRARGRLPARELGPRAALDGADALHRHERVVLARRQARPARLRRLRSRSARRAGRFAQAIEVAHLIRELLDELELPGYVKTSGADGIHVLAPIQRRATFDDTYAFAEAASRLLEARAIPAWSRPKWLKKKRRGVLVDHRQNGWGKTIASVYSVRPKPGAPVSTPLRWDELTPDVRPSDFTLEVALERVERYGDLFRPVLEEPRPLGAAVKRLARLDS